MDQVLHQMSLPLLAERCQHEIRLRHRKETFEDCYCLEIFRRAIVEQIDPAWSLLQQNFGEFVRIWLRSHPRNDLALVRDTEENYISQTFSRFWYAVHKQRIEFSTLNAALSYLHATLNGVIGDTLRGYVRAKEVPLPEPGSQEEPFAEEHDDQAIWDIIQSLLQDERERRVAFLLYYCGFKPREIASRFPEEFGDVKDIYRLNTNIIDRLRRNRNRLRWLLGDEEI